MPDKWINPASTSYLKFWQFFRGDLFCLALAPERAVEVFHSRAARGGVRGGLYGLVLKAPTILLGVLIEAGSLIFYSITNMIE